jgi:septum formation protein
MAAQRVFVAALGLSLKAVANMIILASGSPRRRELLTQVGLTFSVQVFEIDESCLPNEAPAAYVCRLAQQKARAAQAHLPADCTVIAADTTVTVDGHILGKPTDREDAFAMWRLLSGRSHEVMTGVAVACGERVLCTHVVTTVTFLPLTPVMMQAYWDTGEPMGKAGAYAIQGRGAAFIPAIQGSYSNVVGLPLVETLALLERLAQHG